MSGLFEREIQFLRRVEDAADPTNERLPATEEAVRALAEALPGVPDDYLGYLREVGAGSFRECQYQVYEGLRPLEEIAGDDLGAGERVLCFGDDFSGDLGAFLPDAGWTIVEVWPDSRELEPTRQTFREFIRQQMMMGPGGEDQSGDPADPHSTAGGA